MQHSGGNLDTRSMVLMSVLEYQKQKEQKIFRKQMQKEQKQKEIIRARKTLEKEHAKRILAVMNAEAIYQKEIKEAEKKAQNIVNAEKKARAAQVATAQSVGVVAPPVSAVARPIVAAAVAQRAAAEAAQVVANTARGQAEAARDAVLLALRQAQGVVVPPDFAAAQAQVAAVMGYEATATAQNAEANARAAEARTAAGEARAQAASAAVAAAGSAEAEAADAAAVLAEADAGAAEVAAQAATVAEAETKVALGAVRQRAVDKAAQEAADQALVVNGVLGLAQAAQVAANVAVVDAYAEMDPARSIALVDETIAKSDEAQARAAEARAAAQAAQDAATYAQQQARGAAVGTPLEIAANAATASAAAAAADDAQATAFADYANAVDRANAEAHRVAWQAYVQGEAEQVLNEARGSIDDTEMAIDWITHALNATTAFDLNDAITQATGFAGTAAASATAALANARIVTPRANIVKGASIVTIQKAEGIATAADKMAKVSAEIVTIIVQFMKFVEETDKAKTAKEAVEVAAQDATNNPANFIANIATIVANMQKATTAAGEAQAAANAVNAAELLRIGVDADIPLDAENDKKYHEKVGATSAMTNVAVSRTEEGATSANADRDAAIAALEAATKQVAGQAATNAETQAATAKDKKNHTIALKNSSTQFKTEAAVAADIAEKRTKYNAAVQALADADIDVTGANDALALAKEAAQTALIMQTAIPGAAPDADIQLAIDRADQAVAQAQLDVNEAIANRDAIRQIVQDIQAMVDPAAAVAAVGLKADAALAQSQAAAGNVAAAKAVIDGAGTVAEKQAAIPQIDAAITESQTALRTAQTVKDEATVVASLPKVTADPAANAAASDAMVNAILAVSVATNALGMANAARQIADGVEEKKDEVSPESARQRSEAALATAAAAEANAAADKAENLVNPAENKKTKAGNDKAIAETKLGTITEHSTARQIADEVKQAAADAKTALTEIDGFLASARAELALAEGHKTEANRANAAAKTAAATVPAAVQAADVDANAALANANAAEASAIAAVGRANAAIAKIVAAQTAATDVAKEADIAALKSNINAAALITRHHADTAAAAATEANTAKGLAENEARTAEDPASPADKNDLAQQARNAATTATQARERAAEENGKVVAENGAAATAKNALDLIALIDHDIDGKMDAVQQAVADANKAVANATRDEVDAKAAADRADRAAGLPPKSADEEKKSVEDKIEAVKTAATNAGKWAADSVPASSATSVQELITKKAQAAGGAAAKAFATNYSFKADEPAQNIAIFTLENAIAISKTIVCISDDDKRTFDNVRNKIMNDIRIQVAPSIAKAVGNNTTKSIDAKLTPIKIGESIGIAIGNAVSAVFGKKMAERKGEIDAELESAREANTKKDSDDDSPTDADERRYKAAKAMQTQMDNSRNEVIATAGIIAGKSAATQASADGKSEVDQAAAAGEAAAIAVAAVGGDDNAQKKAAGDAAAAVMKGKDLAIVNSTKQSAIAAVDSPDTQAAVTIAKATADAAQVSTLNEIKANVAAAAQALVDAKAAADLIEEKKDADAAVLATNAGNDAANNARVIVGATDESIAAAAGKAAADAMVGTYIVKAREAGKAAAASFAGDPPTKARLAAAAAARVVLDAGENENEQISAAGKAAGAAIVAAGGDDAAKQIAEMKAMTAVQVSFKIVDWENKHVPEKIPLEEIATITGIIEGTNIFKGNDKLPMEKRIESSIKAAGKAAKDVMAEYGAEPITGLIAAGNASKEFVKTPEIVSKKFPKIKQNSVAKMIISIADEEKIEEYVRNQILANIIGTFVAEDMKITNPVVDPSAQQSAAAKATYDELKDSSSKEVLTLCAVGAAAASAAYSAGRPIEEQIKAATDAVSLRVKSNGIIKVTENEALPLAAGAAAAAAAAADKKTPEEQLLAAGAAAAKYSLGAGELANKQIDNAEKAVRNAALMANMKDPELNNIVERAKTAAKNAVPKITPEEAGAIAADAERKSKKDPMNQVEAAVIAAVQKALEDLPVPATNDLKIAAATDVLKIAAAAGAKAASVAVEWKGKKPTPYKKNEIEYQKNMADHAIDKAVPLVNGHFKINLTVAEKQRVKKAARTAAEAAFVLLAGGSTANRNKNIRRYYLHKYLKYKIKYMHMKYEQF